VRHTSLANTGKSVIEYAIVSFIVYEYFSCSAHAPIQVTFK